MVASLTANRLSIDYSAGARVERLLADQYDTFIEVGNGKILGGMLRRMAPEATVLSTGTLDAIDEVLKFKER